MNISESKYAYLLSQQTQKVSSNSANKRLDTLPELLQSLSFEPFLGFRHFFFKFEFGWND